MAKERGIRNLGTSSNPKWMVDVIVRRKSGEGFVHRQRSNIPTKREAQQIYDALKAKAIKIANGEKASTPNNQKQKTYAEVAEYYLNFTKGKIGDNTLHQYEVALNAVSVPHWGETQINTIMEIDVINLLDEYQELKNWSPGAKIFNKRVIKNIFKYAIKQGYYQGRNPCEDIRIRKREKVKNIWNKEQANYFLLEAKKFDHPWYPIWFTALNTGMRSGELFALRWGSVDLGSSTIHIKETWTNKTGFKLPKSGHSRIIDISPELSSLLKELKLRAGNPTRQDFVLSRLSKEIHHQWKKGRQAEVLRNYLQGNNLDLPSIDFHTLRSIWATQMLKINPPHVVQKAGGWSDLKVMQIYIRLAASEIKGSAQFLGIGGAPAKEAEILEFKHKTDL